MTLRAFSASVIIPARNEADHIGAQLRALGRQSGASTLEVVIVDHGSTDRTVEFAWSHRAMFGRLDVLDGSGCTGRSDLRNLGVGASSGHWLLFVDADDIVDDGWLAAMETARPRADVLTGALVRVPFDWPSERSSHAKPYRPRFFGHTIFASNNGAISRRAFDAVGGFDPGTLSRVDVEISLRLEACGFEPTYVPDARLFYRERRDLGGAMRQSFRWERAAVDLYVRYRDRLEFSHSNRNAVKHWLRLAATAPLWSMSSSRRRGALLTLASLSGRLVGSLENRVLWL